MAADNSIAIPPNVKDITGQVFGRWTVLEYAGQNKRHYSTWLMRCACGTERVRVMRKDSPSCGCIRREKLLARNTTHGMSRTAEYDIWVHCLQRCYNPNAVGYKYWGGRGISVCDRWRTSFEAFFEDMGPRPSTKHSLERRNNDGPYAPGNVSWETRDKQARNRRNNRLFTINGKTQCLQTWADELDTSHTTLLARLKRGWSLEETLTTPVKIS